ncbi:MAG: cytochrome c biogenesis protein CcdA, partial [Candidatus Portnoybacteria bacterium]|nr:cytochrome c biogenesis protein CcdA [Candidatus Portnoybacteria bacterium]
MKLPQGKLILAFLCAFLILGAFSYVQAQENACKKGLASLNLTPVAVVCGAAIDAINPCEFAILILLMASMLASQQDRKKALWAGLAFTGAVFISYFLMGIGVFSLIREYTLSFSGIFYKVIGILAIIIGLLNIKDFFWYGKGLLMEVPLSWRPKMKSLIRSITNPYGAFLIGFLVSLFLLPCTSGPYAIILGMLAAKTSFAKAFAYLILYNLIFILPMVIITFAMYSGLPPEKAEAWRKEKIRLLHLIAGIILVALGIVMLGG